VISRSGSLECAQPVLCGSLTIRTLDEPLFLIEGAKSKSQGRSYSGGGQRDSAVDFGSLRDLLQYGHGSIN
jgi:hypothetical protein